MGYQGVGKAVCNSPYGELSYSVTIPALNSIYMNYTFSGVPNRAQARLESSLSIALSTESESEL